MNWWDRVPKGIVYLFKVLYELGVFALIYFVAKFFAEAVG